VQKTASYKIGFSGLKDGHHDFEFDLGEAFFAEREFSEASSGEVKVQVHLNKHPNMMEFTFALKGTVVLPCDRCLQNLSLPVDVEEELIVKFGEEEDLDSEIWVLSENAYELDLEQLLFEFVQLSLPLRKVHSKKDCDPEVLKRLQIEEDENYDSRWDALKNLNLE
jgi:uncharacterized metal-binding protein YceD (DUF177 family)